MRAAIIIGEKKFTARERMKVSGRTVKAENNKTQCIISAEGIDLSDITGELDYTIVIIGNAEAGRIKLQVQEISLTQGCWKSSTDLIWRVTGDSSRKQSL